MIGVFHRGATNAEARHGPLVTATGVTSGEIELSEVDIPTRTVLLFTE